VSNDNLNHKNIKLKGLKKKRKIIYFSKAPMAHKTNSLEHFSINKNSYVLYSKNFSSSIYNSIKDILLVNFLLRETLQKVSTNVFLIESYDVPVLLKY